MMTVEKDQSADRMKGAFSFSAGRSSTSSLRAAEQEREKPQRLHGEADAGKATSSGSSAAPHSFSAGSSDTSPPLPVFKQSLSSALTGSGSGSLSANNHGNNGGAAAADAATPAKGRSTEISREQEGRGEAGGEGGEAKDGRGRLRRGREEERTFSLAGQRSVSPDHSTRVRGAATATKEEDLLGTRRGREAAAAVAGLDTGETLNGGGDTKENEEERRQERNSSTAGEEGRRRWTTLFRGSREGLAGKGEGKGERSLLINSGSGHRASSPTRAGGRYAARQALAVYRGATTAGRDLEGARTHSRRREGRPLAAGAALSNEGEQGRGMLELKVKERKAKKWIIGSLLIYLFLGLLVLYCVSYANVEWCCIFIVFGGVVTGVGLCGLRQANRLTLLIHAVAAAVLLFTLFVAWCYNVYVLLRAVEILLASSWPPPHHEQFQYYYSIPSTYTSPPAPWIEDVLRMRLHFPSQDNAGIEMLIGKQGQAGDGSQSRRRRSGKKRHVLPRHRRRRSEDPLPHTAAAEEAAATKEATPTKEATTAERGETKQATTEDLKAFARPAADVAEERKGQTAGPTTAAQESQQAGKQTPRKLADVAGSTSATRNERKREGRTSGAAHFHRHTSTEAVETLRDAARGRQLATELQQTQERRDAQHETSEKESEETHRRAGENRASEFAIEGREEAQRIRHEELQLTGKDAEQREERRPRSATEERVVGELRAEEEDTLAATETVNSTFLAAAEEMKRRNTQKYRTSLDWERIWREERSAGGMRRRLEETTPAAGSATTETPAAGGSPAAGGGREETRTQSKEEDKRPRRRHPVSVSEAGKRTSPSETSSGSPSEVETVTAAMPSSRASSSSTAAESTTAGGGVTSGLPLGSPSAAKPPIVDTGEDGPVAGQLRGSGKGLPQDREKISEEASFIEPSSSLEETFLSDSDGDGGARAAASLSLTLAAAQETAGAAGGRGQLYEQQQSSTMDRDRAARRLIQGCVEGAKNNPPFVGEAAHAMSSLATRGLLCAFARADVLPFHRWPVDCNRECGYAFLHAGHDLQTENFYDMTRVAEYLIQISSLPPKRMQQCIDYAASTICSIQNRDFFVVWVVLLLLWLLFACIACCGILPFSLYSTVQVIKGMPQHA